jgi:hypothetical protein
MNEIFPPEYYGVGLNYDTAFNNEVDDLLEKFAGGSKTHESKPKLLDL